MSTGMTDINDALRELCDKINNFDLTKEKEKSKIEAMAKGITDGVDSIKGMDGFDEKKFQALGVMFKAASGKAEKYDPTQDTKAAMKAVREKKVADAKKIEETRDARVAAAETIKQAKELYTQQAKVFEVYAQKFNPAALEKRLKSRVGANERKIEDNQKKVDAIIDFCQNSEVIKQKEIIEKAVELKKELDKIKDRIKEIKEIEADIASATANGLSSSTIDGLKAELDTKKNELKPIVAAVASKYSISLNNNDIPTLEASITAAEQDAKNKKSAARTAIINQAKTSKDAYVKKDLYALLNKATEPEKLLAVLDAERDKIEEENLNLSDRNTAVSESLNQLTLGRNTIAAGYRSSSTSEPTPEEIQEQLDADSTLSTALAKAMQPSERNKAVYEWLLKEKGKKPGLHPILALKARFSKKEIEKWENQYNEPTIEEAKNRARAKKATTTGAVAKAQTMESDFKKKLLVHIMGSSKADLDKMEKAAAKGQYGAGLTKVYRELEDQEYDK